MNVDILLTNACIIPSSGSPVIENGWIGIKEGQIVAIESNQIENGAINAPEIFDLKGKWVLPGLINTHTHTGNTVFRGAADDLPLDIWLTEHIFPLEKEFCNAETSELSVLLAMAEMIKSGTTQFSDMYFFQKNIATRVEEVGMRAELCETVMDFPTPSSKDAAYALTYSEEFIQHYAQHPLISPAVAVHAPYTCGEVNMKKAKGLAEKYNTGFRIHVSETRKEVLESKQKLGVSPVKWLSDIGCLDIQVLAAHCVHIDEEDMQIMLEAGAKVSHNPQSNMKLGSGVAPVPTMLKKGLDVALGTDGAGSNNGLNMYMEMQFAAKIQKAVHEDSTLLTAYEVFEMATAKGAKCLNHEKKTGELAVGGQADMQIINNRQLHMNPVYDPISHLVYVMNGSEVEDVMVAGNWLMRNRKLQTIDEERLLDQVNELKNRIANWNLQRMKG